jgi:uncharacterized protein
LQYRTGARLNGAMSSRISRRAALLGLAATPAFAALGPRGYELTQPTLYVDDLDPAHEGLRVAQISDIHVRSNTPDDRVLSAIREINALKPDLVFLTGDFLTYSRSPIPQVSELLEGLHAPTLAVLGNHDHFVDAQSVIGSLNDSGYAVLRNQHTVMRVRGAPLTVFGIDDGGTGNDDVAKTFKGASRGGTRLVMTHNPITARKLPQNEGLLCFSGHTHGGQIVIPPITDAVMRAAGQPYIRGRYDVSGNQLYVNRGLGFGRHQQFLHHGSEPEVAVFTLKSRQESWPDIGR